MVLIDRISLGRLAAGFACAAAMGSLQPMAAQEAASAAPSARVAPSEAFAASATVSGAARLEAFREDEDALAAPRQQPRRGAWLGVGLACTNCSYHSEGKSISEWVFSVPPVLYSVDPGSPADRAGLRSGDTLVFVDGLPLVSARGGQAFANLRPGVDVRLGYRRGGRARTATVTPLPPPTSREASAASLSESLRQAERAMSRASDSASRAQARTYQRDAERAQHAVEQAQREMARSQGKFLSDSSMRRLRVYLDQAREALGSDASPYFPAPARPPFAVAPTAPTPAPYAVPAPGAAPEAPRNLGYAVAPPGRLRYSGRLGSTIIEARRPGGVQVVETGDSEVVLTGGDLAVRVALEPARTVGGRIGRSPVGWGSARSTVGDVAYGIQGYLINPRLGAALGASSGVLVLDVARGSLADSLGIMPGDVLVTLNDHPVIALVPDAQMGGRPLHTPTAAPRTMEAVVVRSHGRRALSLPARGRRPAATPAPGRRP